MKRDAGVCLMAVSGHCTCRPSIKAHLWRNCRTCDDLKPALANLQLRNISAVEIRIATLMCRKHGLTVESRWSDWLVLITTILVTGTLKRGHRKSFQCRFTCSACIFGVCICVLRRLTPPCQLTSRDYQQSFRAISDSESTQIATTHRKLSRTRLKISIAARACPIGFISCLAFRSRLRTVVVL